MYTLINSSGQFLTNYGMQKYWFSISLELAYTFDNYEEAQRFSQHFENTKVYTIYTKF
jgi:hypothetical protein